MGSSPENLPSVRIGGPLAEPVLAAFLPPRPLGPDGAPGGMSTTDWMGFSRP